MLALGIANHGPEQLFSYLHKTYGICVSKFTQVPIGGYLSKHERTEQNILFYTSQDFFNHIRHLSKAAFKNKRVFVLGACQKLITVKGLIPLDYQDIETERFYDFKLMDTFLPLPEVTSPIERLPTDYIDILSSKVQNGSILTSLMTVIYTIPRTVNQKAITFGICKWFYNCETKEDLIKFLEDSAKPCSVSKNIREKLIDILTCDVASNFRKAFAKMKTLRSKNKEFEVAEIANLFDVPAFELRYINIKYINDDLYQNHGKRSVDNLVDGKEK